MYDYFDKILLEKQNGFRKGFSIANYSMIGKFKESLNQGRAYSALLTDLLKVLDYLHHEPHIPKLHGYGLGMSTLKRTNYYLTKRKQRVKTNDVHSSSTNYVLAIIGLLLFNISLCDLFTVIPNYIG